MTAIQNRAGRDKPKGATFASWRLRASLAAALAIATATVGYAQSPPRPKTAAGFWLALDDDGNPSGWFYFVERNGVYEGRIVKMFKKPGEQNLVTTCARCPGIQKDAQMLGLTIIKGMIRDGAQYENGSILDPRDGATYHAQMQLSDDGQKLYVRGYLGIPLLGQTQTWTRLPDNAIAPADVPKETLAFPPSRK